MAPRRWLISFRKELGRLRNIPFPLVHALRHYTTEDFRGDAGASLQSALMAYPRAMCCAFVAGLPVSFGIMGAAVASIIGSMFATSRFLVLLPTRTSAILLLSLLLTRHPTSNPAEVVSLLTLFVAVLLLVASYFDLGRAARLISRSVFVGYACGAGLLVLFSQLHWALGFDTPKVGSFYEVCDETFRRLEWTHMPSLAVASGSAAAWLLIAIRWPGSPASAIVLVGASLAGAILNANGVQMAMIGAVSPQALFPHLPTLNLVDFSSVASSAVAIALLGIAESSFVAKRIGAQAGEPDYTNREMFRIGASNAIASFFMAMPAFASPYCSRVRFSGGARTSVSCLFTGVLLTAGLVVFGSMLRWTPMPAVAAVAICLCIRIVRPSDIRIAACSTPEDSIVFLITFFAALLTPLDIALYFGIGSSVLFVLRRLPEPGLAEYTIDRQGHLLPKGTAEGSSDSAITMLHVEGERSFGSGDALFAQVCRVCHESKIRVVILQMRAPRALDASSLIAIRELLEFLHRTNRHLVIAGASREVRGALRNSGLIDAIGSENVLVSGRGNPLLATREALARASEILDGEKAPMPTAGHQRLDI